MADSGFDVGYVARLAHIDLTDEETGLFSVQLGVPPMMHGREIVNAFREDEPVAHGNRDGFLANAPGRIGDEYRLPKIVEDA